MRRVLEPLTEQLTCEQCHQAMKKRMRDVIVQWASVTVQVNYAYNGTLLTCMYAENDMITY